MNETKLQKKHMKVVIAHEPKLRTWENFNIAALTMDGRTISTQMWDGSYEKAKQVVVDWAKDEEWHGKVLRAIIHNHQTKATTEIRFGNLTDTIIEEKTI